MSVILEESSSIMMPKASLPPGFRFHPTDAELVCYYLKRKVMGKPLPFNIVAELELYKFAPWDLPDKSCLKSKDLKWYFFCSRDLKYANGSRTNRATDIGYWKTTGRDRSVFHRSRTVGMIKTLIFHEGKPPGGVRTDWVMYEYRLEDKELTDAGIPQGAFVLCKVFQKSGRGPKNGEQYGAPFNEEDWEDDTGIECSGSVSCMFSSPALLEDQAIMLEPGPPAPVVSGIGEVSSMPMPEGDDELWKVLFEALRESPHNLGGAQGETSSAPVLHSQIHAGDVLLEGMYDGLRDLPGCAELKQVGGNCTITESNEYNLQPECGPEFYVNVDDEQFLMDINPSELVIPDDLLAYDIFENLPAFQTMNDNGVSALPVDDAVPTAASITDSLPGANTYQNQCAPNVEINAHREDDNQQTDAELHQLVYPVWQPDYGANIYSTRGVGGSGSKKSFSYSDPSTSFCYPHR